MKTMNASVEGSVGGVSPAEVGTRRALLLDVRTPAEFAEVHIEGSVLHPLSDLNAAEVAQLAAGKDECILVCRSGNRARQAAEKLVSSGMRSVKVLEGGVQAWEAAGLPLQRGRRTISLERQVRIAAGTLVLTGALLAYRRASGVDCPLGFRGGRTCFCRADRHLRHGPVAGPNAMEHSPRVTLHRFSHALKTDL